MVDIRVGWNSPYRLRIESGQGAVPLGPDAALIFETVSALPVAGDLFSKFLKLFVRHVRRGFRSRRCFLQLAFNFQPVRVVDLHGNGLAVLIPTAVGMRFLKSSMTGRVRGISGKPLFP